MTDLDALYAAMRAHVERFGAAPELTLRSPGGENLSVIARLPAAAAEGLAEVARQLAPAGSPHRAYDAEGMHVTVLNLDPWRRVGGDAETLADAALEAAAATAGPVRARVCGLNLAPGIVFAQLLADGLAALRGAMVAALDALAPGRFLPWGPALAGAENGHVTVVRFAAAGPIDPALLDAVAARRTLEVGAPFAIGELELVHLVGGKTLRDGTTVRRCAIGVGP